MPLIEIKTQQLPDRWTTYRGYKASSLEEAKELLHEKYPWWNPQNAVVYPTKKDDQGNIMEAHYYFPTDIDRGY